MKYQSGFQSRSLKKLATSFPIWLEVIASDALEIKARFFPRFNSNLKIDVSQEWSDVIWCYRFDVFFICGWRFEKAWAKKKSSKISCFLSILSKKMWTANIFRYAKYHMWKQSRLILYEWESILFAFESNIYNSYMLHRYDVVTCYVKVTKCWITIFALV